MQADAVIVGGGFAGAATAYFLTRAGVADVIVAEREDVCGLHASGRNAALGRQLTEHDVFTDLAIRGAAFLRHPPDGFAEQALLSEGGSLLLAGTPETLARLVEGARARDLPCEAVTAAAVIERWPLLTDTPMTGAVLFPTDGVIDIHALLHGFLSGARRGGARIRTGCEVLGFAPAGGRVCVTTNLGDIDARCVVVAAGAWAGSIGTAAGAGAASLLPLRRHLHLTEPIAALDASAPFAWHLDDEFYARPESGACLISACDEAVVEPCDPTVQPDAVPQLADKLARMAPRMADLGLQRSWACLRTFVPDRRSPRIGWDPAVPWLFWTAALGGHGATCSSAIGEQAAAAIAARLR